MNIYIIVRIRWKVKTNLLHLPTKSDSLPNIGERAAAPRRYALLIEYGQ